MPWAVAKKKTHTWPKRTAYAGSGWAWQRLRASVLQRDGYRCRWCGGAAVTADHVQARAFGGPDTMENLVAACKACNTRRAHQQSKEGQRRKGLNVRASAQPRRQAKSVTQW